MNLSELQAVREKIAQGWTQRVDARDRQNFCVSPGSENAVCWCLSGAAAAVGVAFEDVGRALGLGTSRVVIECWNDASDRTQAEVLARLDAAIAKAQPSPSDTGAE